MTAERDPADWSAVIAVFFLALVWWRLGIPSRIYFDEVHYVAAARHVLDGTRFNPEHPMLGKTVLAAAIAWLGDKPLYWRVPSALAGAIGLFAFARLMWFATQRRTVTLAAQFLLATNFLWFVQSRIAMLDMVMAMLAMVGLWLCASALRRPDTARLRLAGGGIALGLALGAKWSVAPLVAAPGLIFALAKLKDAGARFIWARSGGAVPGITVAEAALWLGLLPLAVYWLTFWPAFHWASQPVDPFDPVGWHQYMLQLQDSVVKPHPYRSQWWQWAINERAIWYLYEVVDGAQRGIVLIGNPFTMLAGLPALVWCLWAGLRHDRRDALGFAVLYLLCLTFWALSGKPVQFYYHYLLPGTFLMACLALALEQAWARADRWRWLAPASLIISAAMLAWFYPIISAAPLSGGKMSYEQWMWLPGWR